MIPSKNALDLIQHWESCRLTAYQDVRGIWTIGWGSTGPGIVEGLSISQQTADGMLLGHIREVGLFLTDLLGNTLRQNQFDAITSLVYNIGEEAFRCSTLCKLLKAGRFTEAAEEFPKWDHSGGMEVPGLLNRRLAEQQLFLSSI